MEYNNAKEDNWFKYKGVPPPERVSHHVTADELDKMLARNRHKCQWRQQGPNIFCDEAPDYRHGIRIGVNKMLVKTGKGGEPILKDFKINA